jgi:hypothetical protein
MNWKTTLQNSMRTWSVPFEGDTHVALRSEWGCLNWTQAKRRQGDVV